MADVILYGPDGNVVSSSGAKAATYATKVPSRVWVPISKAVVAIANMTAKYKLVFGPTLSVLAFYTFFVRGRQWTDTAIALQEESPVYSASGKPPPDSISFIGSPFSNSCEAGNGDCDEANVRDWLGGYYTLLQDEKFAVEDFRSKVPRPWDGNTATLMNNFMMRKDLFQKRFGGEERWEAWENPSLSESFHYKAEIEAIVRFMRESKMSARGFRDAVIESGERPIGESRPAAGKSSMGLGVAAGLAVAAYFILSGGQKSSAKKPGPTMPF